MLSLQPGSATVYYVNAANPAPVSPYTSWDTAATNIQDAIEATTQAGDVVVVTNGLYTYGGKVMAGTQPNRVVLSRAITVQSVNGPSVTTIQGGNGTNGFPSTRCAWLTNGATLSGFTLEGASLLGAESGAGVWCASSNVWVANCIICSNIDRNYGGGAYAGTLKNCAIYRNASSSGGGTYLSYLNNCTVVSNTASLSGGGSYYGGFTNCIIYFNSHSGSADNAVSPGAISYCCTYPMPSGGIGNITNTPQVFVDSIHLFTNSPCIGAGINQGAGTDIDGQPWLNPPSMGCSEVPAIPLVSTPTIGLAANGSGFVAMANVTAVGPWSCGWLLNGAPVQDNGPVSASQTPTLTVGTIAYAYAGGYQLVVSNSFGVTTSAVAQVVMHCVDAAGTNPQPPYSTWATAATNIQDAITAAAAGDIVLVTNGVYANGGVSMDGVITNRVSINKAILVQSVNGADVTIIQGAWDPATNGPAAVRGVWMTNNAILGGFTICGGATRSIQGSAASYGGGVVGTSNSIVVNCVIRNNAAALLGGGATGGNLVHCVVATNFALGIPGSGVTAVGGGTDGSNLTNCLVAANYALTQGGGCAYGKLANCAIVRNSAGQQAGGVYYGTLVNCTVAKNASLSTSYANGGGAVGAVFTGCIVYGNSQAVTYSSANSNYYTCTFSYSCTAPAAAGTSNITSNPLLLGDDIHLSATSPCIGAGSAAAVSGTDIDGQPWNNPPAIGCDEWSPAPIIAAPPSVSVGSPLHALALKVVAAGQAPFSYLWTHNGVPVQDDGHYSNSSTANLVVNNFGPDDGGIYQVVVTNSFGAATSPGAQATIHAVNVAAANPVAPYTSWATAAAMIQDAVNVSAAGDIVLVTNGIYADGGKVIGALTNRVALTVPVTLISVNGYQDTVIQGAWDPTGTNGPAAVRCAYVADGGALNGFTVCNGATLKTGNPDQISGGGIYCVSTNGQAVACVISNNSAYSGGGFANGTLNNTAIVGNLAAYSAGGTLFGVLNNCTVANNHAGVQVGGTYSSLVRNSIVVGNTSGPYLVSANYNAPSANFLYSCTDPFPSVASNVNVDPEFLNGWSLAVNSRCYGAGNAVYASGYDLDGQPWNNPPSMGCREVVPANLTGPLSVNIQSVWTNLLANRFGSYAGLITGRAAWVSWAFGDGVTVSNRGAASVYAWTNAGDYHVTFTAYNNDNPQGVSASLLVHVLPLLAPQVQMPELSTNGIQFQFAAQTNANYTIQYATNLVPPITWLTLTNVYFNQQGTVQVRDYMATNDTRFYRVLAQ